MGGSVSSKSLRAAAKKGKIFAFIQIGYLIDSLCSNWLLEGDFFFHVRCRFVTFFCVFDFGQAEALMVVVCPCTLGNLELNSAQLIIQFIIDLNLI